ncbi:DUF4296 domain-containing protein [Pedobacter sandarakinus]|uniref:DUF4296 domain-containing protein n=1 Tax=Pedobacter sandarakinus TaxID=353156 RepID=UPI0022472675|nr:DUF4296 domain-containing protein [Pedobacter sandarakinus]MCX2575143.1 DUF4296 domain-containing protein [Pedobacter sandarakinus]
MKQIFCGLIVALFCVACKPKAPDGIIEQERMEKILFDIHVVDGYLSTIYAQDSARKVASKYYRGIYKKFDTDSAGYTNSLNYYYQNPTILAEIYASITKQLASQKKAMLKADSLIMQRKFNTDSIKIIKKFKADSSAIRKKMKPDSLSKVKAVADIAKKKKVADSILKVKKATLIQSNPVALPVQ